MNNDRLNAFQSHNLTSGSMPQPKLGSWVEIPGQYLPAQLFENRIQQIQINFISTVEPAKTAGRLEKRGRLTLVFRNMTDMLKEITKRFGSNVSYTETDPGASKQVLQREYLDQRAREAHQKDLEKAAETGLATHRELCLADPAAANQAWKDNALRLLNRPEFAGERRAFFNWPLESGKPTFLNWKILVDICHRVIGVPRGCAPVLKEIVAAYEYGRDNSNFHQVTTYKRSQEHIKNSVLPVTERNMQVTAEGARNSAMAKVNAARLPAGTRMDWDRAQKIGLTEFEFAQLVAPVLAAQEQSYKDLQKEVRSGFTSPKPTMAPTR